eukprot:m.72751 g.72751  ORF g.72751 m.72751 type:complete len:154 (+) comp16115_c0_seq7:112-573(+)
MPAASKASRSATRVLDIAARERRIRKRIEKLEEDCGQEENFQDVAAAAPFDDDGGNGDGKKSTQGGRSSKKRKRLSASSSRLRRTLDSLITEANLADIDTATPTYLSAAMGPPMVPPKHICVVTGDLPRYQVMVDGCYVKNMKTLIQYNETKR